MPADPYLPPRKASLEPAVPSDCRRRPEIVVILAAMVALLSVSTISAFAPSLQSIGVPDRTWVTLCGWCPIVFLVFYTWTPSPKLLAKASVMCAVAAVGNAIVLLSITALVESPGNPALAYSWAIVPFAIAGCYIRYAAWLDRNQLVTHPLAAYTGG